MRRISLVVIFALSVALCAADKVQPLNLKAGLWQVTTVANPDMPVPASVLDKLTPEERSRVEDRMNAPKPKHGKTQTTKECLTRKQLDHGIPFQPNRNSCRWNVLASSSSKVSLRVQCSAEGVNTSEAIEIEVLNTKEAEGSVRILTNGNNAATGGLTTFQAKWIGPECRSR